MLEVNVDPGKYVLAVSGGVDSMVLLDMLCQVRGVELVVAHFDHGIRPDSAGDRQLVEEVAAAHDLPFVYAEGKLGADASEAMARTARYRFLQRVQKEQGAQALITAHHEDDLLETAILNILRGTARLGLSSLRSRPGLLRPLLDVPKAAILRYGQAHHLKWREDSSNQNDRYLRNYIRSHILPQLGSSGRRQLLQHLQSARTVNAELDRLLAELLAAHLDMDTFKRGRFIQLPHDVAVELMAAWLREHGVRNFNKKLLDRLVVAAKTAKPGKVIDINASYLLSVHYHALKLKPR